MIGERIAAQAEQWIDTPFHWQASVRAVGCDCKGLLAGVARELDLPEGRSVEALAGDYRENGYQARLLAGLAHLFDRVKERAPGDVLLITIHRRPIHLAIAAPQPGDPNRAIEALAAGAFRVRPVTVMPHRVHSIWRWRIPPSSSVAVGN